MAINFPTIPQEVWVRIAQYCAIAVCSTFSRVSKLFNTTIVHDPVLAETWKRGVYAFINPGSNCDLPGPGFGLLLSALLEGRDNWRETFLAYVVVMRSLATRQPYIENGSFRTSVLTVAKNTIDSVILIEEHLCLDAEEDIEGLIEDMRASQRRLQSSEDYETLFLNLKTLDNEQQNDPEVCHYLSECYFRGIGTEINSENAFTYAHIAATKGCIPARCNLGAFYAKGFGVLQDYDQAITWLETLTTPQAKYFMGIIKRSPEKPDFQTAFHLIEEAAIEGHKEAQYRAGQYYRNGFGEGEDHPVVTKIDPAKAFNFFSLSAHQGIIGAIFRLGNCYLQGFGTQKCFAKGLACFELVSRYHKHWCDCSPEIFAGIESKEDQQKMWQFLEEESERGNSNADGALQYISEELEEWKDAYLAFKKRKLE